MNNGSTTTNLSFVTRFFHWLIALAIIGMLIFGFLLDDFKEYSGLHKSIGAIIFVVATCRILWRIKEGWPTPVNMGVPQWNLTLAKVTHWILILLTVLLPLSGMCMSVAAGRGLNVFGAEIFASNIVDGKAVALNPSLAGFAHDMHETLPVVLIIMLVLHIVGALYHHVVLKDRTLSRMMGH